MIYDKIENAKKYQGISKWLDVAIDFIEKTDLQILPEGRTEIAEDKVFANVMCAEAQEAETKEFEIHRKYMDIQIDLEGTEMIQTGMESEHDFANFNEETDFGTVPCKAQVSCIMGAGKFIVCMAGEPHKPGIAVGKERHLRKCVIKVAAE